MRRAAVIPAVLVLAFAPGGCGLGSDDERPASAGAAGAPLPKGDWGPEEPGSGERPRPVAPPRKAPSRTVAGALDAGAVGVVGVEGAVGVRPPTLDVSADGTLEDVVWARWDSRGAEGSGTLTVRDCDPTCASGGRDRYPATIRLSAPRLCGRSTYFDEARVQLDRAPADVDEPTTYVRAPC